MLVSVDPCDLLGHLTDAELVEELERRKMEVTGCDVKQDLERVWLDMRGKEAPASLRELLWAAIGKIL